MARATSLIAAAVCLLAAAAAHAGPTQGAFPDLPTGVTASVLGAAATATDAEPAAFFWNPAALLESPRRGFQAGTAELYRGGLLRHHFGALVWPRFPRRIVFDDQGRVHRERASQASWAAGLGGSYLGLDAQGDLYREVRLGLALARRTLLGARLGLGIHYLSAGGEVPGMTASGYDMDLAIRLPSRSWWRAALVVRHLLSSLSWEGGDAESLNRRLLLGAALRPGGWLELPLGLEWEARDGALREAAAGVQWCPGGGVVTLLAGVRYRPDGIETTRAGLGLRLRWRNYIAGYAFSPSGSLGDAHRFEIRTGF
jgi:hypothetical protein